MVIERRVRGAGLSLFVTEYGERGRPTVVLVHGFPDTSAVWEPVADRLASDLHVVAYDVRGAGRSDATRERDGYALATLVDDLDAVLDQTSPDAPVHLVAHDWGSVQGWEAVTTKGWRLASPASRPCRDPRSTMPACGPGSTAPSVPPTSGRPSGRPSIPGTSRTSIFPGCRS